MPKERVKWVRNRIRLTIAGVAGRIDLKVEGKARD
jgi:hypothetical protein